MTQSPGSSAQSPVPPSASDDTAPAGQPSLLRALGPGMAMAVVVGNVIGSGIYLKPGGIARQAGDFRVILAAWVVGGVICLLGALCLAELGTMLPRAGGLYVYLREAYGKPVAFLYGWTDFLFSRPASIGALTVIFVGMFAQALDWRAGALSLLGIQIAVIAGMAWLNVLGVIWGGRLQGLTTLAKGAFLGSIALLPFIMSLLGRVPLDPSNWSSTITPGTPGVSSRFAIALLGVLWAYNGWEAIGSVAEEIRDPQRNIPRALFGGLALLIVLYVGANVAYHVALPMQVLADAGDRGAERFGEALLGPPGRTMIVAGLMLSTFSGINSNTLLGPRVSFAMGRDGVFFRRLGRVHPTFHTPAAAIVVQAFMSAALVTASFVLVQTSASFRSKSVFDVLTDYVVFASSIFYLLMVIGVIVLRRRQPNAVRPYRTWGYPYVPLFYAVFYAWFLFEIYRGDPAQANVGLALIALGLPAYAWWHYSSLSHQAGRGPG